MTSHNEPPARVITRLKMKWVFLFGQAMLAITTRVMQLAVNPSFGHSSLTAAHNDAPLCSIHAPREESDRNVPASDTTSDQFQSTLPVRRATVGERRAAGATRVSIPAIQTGRHSLLNARNTGYGRLLLTSVEAFIPLPIPAGPAPPGVPPARSRKPRPYSCPGACTDTTRR